MLNIDKFKLVSGKIIPFTAGDNLLMSSDIANTTKSTTYTKVKEIYVGTSGIVRVKFSLCSLNSSTAAYGQIYKNGIAVGTLRQITTTTPTVYTEDIAVKKGDLIQIYAKSPNTAYTTSISFFQLYTGTDFLQCIYDLK